MAKEYLDETGLAHFWDNIKGEIGNASDAQVDDWLDRHPEATTTVQDNSINGATKLIDGSVTDSKLVQSGGVLGEVSDLKSALEETEDSLKTYAPNSKIGLEPVKTALFAKDKYWYRVAGDSTTAIASGSGFKYLCIPLSAMSNGIFVHYNDIDTDYVGKNMVCFTASAEIGAAVINYLSVANIKNGYHSITEYDSTTGDCVFSKTAILADSPTAAYLWINLKYATDYVRNIVFSSSKSVEDRLDDLEETVQPISDKVDELESYFHTDAPSPNLFDDSTYVDGYYINNTDGEPVAYSGWGYINANVSPGTYYLIGALTSSTTYDIITDLYIGYYDSEGTFISGEIKSSSSDGKITVPSGASIAKVSTHNYALGHGSPSSSQYREKQMLVTTAYYASNVHSTADYVEYNAGSDAYLKEEHLPNSVVFNSDLDEYDLVPAVESFFEDEVTATVNSILSKCDAPCTVLTVVTDSHVNMADTANLSRSEDTFNNLRTVNEKVWSDALVHLGDMLVANVQSITQVMADQQLNYIRTRLSDAKMPLYITQGNHDGLGGSAPQTQNYSSLSKFNSAYVVRNGDDPYFYVDMEQPKVRLIFLAFPQRVTIGGTEYNYWGLHTNQLRWLGQVALNVDDGCNVIICSHIGTQSEDFRKNKDQTVGICNAFNSHGTFDVYDDNSPTKLYTADFTNLTESKIVLWVCGHEHYDWNIPESRSGLTFPLVTFTCSNCYNGSVPPDDAALGAVAPSRASGTVTQDAWTTVIYRPDENKIYFIRFGAGNDFTIDLTDYTSFS